MKKYLGFVSAVVVLLVGAIQPSWDVVGNYMLLSLIPLSFSIGA